MEMLSHRPSLLPHFRGAHLPNVWGNPHLPSSGAPLTRFWVAALGLFICRNILQLGMYFSDSGVILSLDACTMRLPKNQNGVTTRKHKK